MREDRSSQEILLESGTNEMEILEFYLGEQSFGINVQKLREIIQYEPEKTTTLPESKPSVMGTYLVRGQSITLIDLNKHLNPKQPNSEGPERPIVLVCQFNGKVTGFMVDDVNQIHRISWEDVRPMAPFIDKFRPRFTGSINVGSKETLIVDLEHILTELDPELSKVFTETKAKKQDTSAEGLSKTERRQKIRLMMAEDSAIIRTGIQRVLINSGYTQLTTFIDGHECYQALKKIHEQVASEEEFLQQLHILITDIEMPKMDGLTLCRKVREELGLKNLKVIMFSSLITEQMAAKCTSVGANGSISKPQIPELVEMVDQLCL
jgi:two-component system chemotaxis response regulator CheV